MIRNKKIDPYVVVSAICILLIMAFSIAVYANGYFGDGDRAIMFSTSIYMAMLIGLTQLLAARKIQNSFVAKFGSVVFGAAATIVYIYIDIFFLIEDYNYAIHHIPAVVISLLLFTLILLSVISPLKGKVKVLITLWFIEGVLVLINSLCYFFAEIYQWGIDLYIVVSVVGIVAFVLIVLWIKKCNTATEEKTPAPQNADFGSMPVDNAEHKLEILTELLESGVLTQEEFEEKKNQISPELTAGAQRKLEMLEELLESGVLTQEEFDAKRNIISRQ